MRIVIITGNNYPCGDAGAVRQHAMAKLLMDMGHKVFVIGYGTLTDNQEKTYDSVPYISFRKRNKNKLLRAYYRLNFGSRVVKFLEKKKRNFDCLIVVDVLPKAFKQIKQLARQSNALLIHDSVEWYSPEQFENGEKNRRYKNKEHTNLVAIDKDWRVIAISKYLEEHFTKRCDRVVRIPVIMDVQNIECSLKHEHRKLVFVYAGAPNKKDCLKEIVYGFQGLSAKEKSKVEVHIVGVNYEQLISVCEVEECCLKELSSVLFAHGRVSRDEAVKWVGNADFSLLLRDESLRYAKAGFPTKIVESLACGTPVVCNLSSDLGEYLEDGKNAFLIVGHSYTDVTDTIKQILARQNDDFGEMRKQSRNTAEKYFDYHDYRNEMEYILQR